MDNMNIVNAINTLKVRKSFVASMNLDAILAYDLAIDALEKQLPKKPYQKEYDTEWGKIAPVGINDVPYKLCPCCDKVVWGSRLDIKEKHCNYCGQKLDWD